jgi:hypothetical protein
MLNAPLFPGIHLKESGMPNFPGFRFLITPNLQCIRSLNMNPFKFRISIYETVPPYAPY